MSPGEQGHDRREPALARDAMPLEPTKQLNESFFSPGIKLFLPT